MDIKANFEVTLPPVAAPDADPRAEFRKRAIESISGSMVFVEDRLIYWDLKSYEL